MPEPDFPTPALSLDRDDAAPLSVQLYRQFRDLILSGRLPPGRRLPSTRALAAEQGVSRTTAVTAYDQLVAEGFLDSRRGAGVFVAELPQGLLKKAAAPAVRDGPAPVAVAGTQPRLPGRPFDLGAPDPAEFPAGPWSRALARSWRSPDRQMFHGAAGGFPPLRRAVAEHLRLVRGVPCDWRQVIVTASATESIELVARGLLSPGDAAWVEDPGYSKAQSALATAGLRPVPVPVDTGGFDVTTALRAAPDARLAVVTPSRQFPLGMTMPLARRLALLDWASASGGFVIEDDYDSEFRYAGRPIAPLAGLDRGGRVVYLGSFTKVMFRALRLGYLVAPAAAVDDLLAVQREFGGHSSMVAQPALAEFVASGAFAAHIRRMRRLYAARQRTLIAALSRRLGGVLHVEPQDYGMHLVATFAGPLEGRDDVATVRRCMEGGIDVSPLSTLYRAAPPVNGLLLGYAGWGEEALEEATETLAEILKRVAAG